MIFMFLMETFGNLDTINRFDDDDADFSVLLSSGVAFTLNGLGYVTTGESSGVSTNLWVYDPVTDTWDEDPNFEGTCKTRCCFI